MLFKRLLYFIFLTIFLTAHKFFKFAAIKSLKWAIKFQEFELKIIMKDERN